MQAATNELDPLRATEEIRAAYLRYLRTAFPLQDPTLGPLFWQALDRAGLTKGPLLEASPPFRTGRPLAQLIADGILHPDMQRLAGPDLPFDRPLYRHQERAIEQVVRGGRNVVVATGTGSGKTESFLIPIFDSLMREKEAGTLAQPGVRALLLYPMNALANDQLKRLRRLLGNVPEITFGRYTGETKERAKDAQQHFEQFFPAEPRLPNELLSRDEMRERPPRILLTNYAMLEYLLLRPRDCNFFDGETGRHWRFVVLDEAHTYDGATGIEIAMLLRRLKDRVVRSEPGRLRCIATSATLGRGRNDFPAVAKFAAALFGEPFEWEPNDPARQDVVEAEREDPETSVPPWGEGSAELYARLHAALVGDETADHDTVPVVLERLARAAREAGVPPDTVEAAAREAQAHSEPAHAFLWALLRGDSRLTRLRARLAERPELLEQLSGAIFPELERKAAQRALVSLVSIAVRARPDGERAALLPARYHLFVRALEGAFVCLRDHATLAAGSSPLSLERREQCPECKGRMFEFASCSRCGAGYVVGDVERGDDGIERLQSLQPLESANRRIAYVLLNRQGGDTDEDEEVAAEIDSSAFAGDPARLCTGCGALLPADAALGACGCAAETPYRPVLRHLLKREEGYLPKCLACGALAGTGEVVFRFLTGQDAPVAVLATALYQQIPPDKSGDTPRAGVSDEGRKFLSFADSRQDAAFFAPYLQRTYDRIMRRRLITETVRSCETNSALRLQDLVPRVRQRAEAAGVFTQGQSSDERQRVVWTWLLQELTAWDRQNSLEGLGLVQFRLVRPQGWQPPAELLQSPWRLSVDEAWTLICLLMDSVRQQGAITFPDGVSPTDEAFAPRKRALFLRGTGPERSAGILAWRPQRGSNRRSDLLQRLAERCAPTADSTEALLTAVWDHISAPSGPWRDHLVKETRQQHGVVFRLSHQFWEVVPTPSQKPDGWYRCDTCRTLTPLNVRNLCPRYRCAGTLEPWRPDGEEWEANHYRYLYETLAPVPLCVVEHTAQWTSEEAAAIQDRFVRGEVNALSCSTTFELGVDVGELQAVLMRNVPPTTANYVQRAGRAGRRTDAAAFALTYAQRRSHDLTHYADPVALVAGRITPPVVLLENEPIIRRHMHAVLFAAFLREEREKHGREYGQVGAFFADGEENERGADRLRRFAEARPRAVQEALQRIVPPELPETLRPDSWGWLRELYQEPEGQAGGLLGRVCDEVRADLETLARLEQDAADAKRYSEAGRCKRMADTIRHRDLLGFLSTRGLLPKYGFPVDVVELRTAHADVDVGRKLELERDLRIAIGDYAPGGEVIAGGYLWRSRGLHVVPGRTWPEYEYAYCRACGWFVRSIERGGGIPGTCAVCGQTIRGGTRGTFVVPSFGFVADRHPGSPGEARPQRSYASRVYFSRYDPPAGIGEPDFEPVDGLSNGGGITVTQRYARYGRLAVINSGPEGGGFRICRQCGYADVALGATGKKGTQHKWPWTGNPCKGTLTPCHLGHEFLTDTLELRLDGPRTYGYDTGAWRSVLYALLEGAARELGISRADLDGTLRGYAMGTAPALVLFDDVPGGAGYCRRIKESLPAVFRKAREVVEQCACGEETSCYQCLRNFRNQPYHHELRRDKGLSLLREFP